MMMLFTARGRLLQGHWQTREITPAFPYPDLVLALDAAVGRAVRTGHLGRCTHRVEFTVQRDSVVVLFTSSS
jgi:hypothetical protein